jgi:mannosyl-3-phosphoglycerate phosphatase
VKLVIFSDLDHTLLDPETYHPGPALSTLKMCTEKGISVCFCTSKTCAEVLRIRDALNNNEPFIVEDGGAIYWDEDYFSHTCIPGEARRLGRPIRWNLGSRSGF